MPYLITLKLDPSKATLTRTQELLETLGLTVDDTYGLVNISPKRGLYVVRIEGEVNEEQLMALPEIVGVHGDVRIAPFSNTNDDNKRN